MKKDMLCPMCLSSRWYPISTSRSNSVGKAVVGTLLFGPIGATAGIGGKKETIYKCEMCGYSKIYTD